MATPVSNTVGATTFDPLSTGDGRYVTSGFKWGGALGTGVTLTYSFPQGTASFISGYSEFSSWYSTTPAERNAIKLALKAWSDVANITFVQSVDNSTTVGELRFTMCDMSDFAHAYYPSSDPSAGDVWFGHNNWNTDRSTVPLGDYDYETIVHEIGHAIGLKHSFESPYAIPAQYDNMFYSVMSYTASPWSPHQNNYATFFPTTPMYYDLVAIQAMYGRNMSHNAGNTNYVFNDGQRYFQTIDDAGGTDTITFNGIQSCEIDLRDKSFSSVSESIMFANGHSSRSTVCIGPGTVIERALGGSGNDTLIGNGVGNALLGRGGNDILKGFAANDVLNGGIGHDTLVGGGGADSFNFLSPGESGVAAGTRDIIADFVHLVDKINLSAIDASTVLGGNNTFVFRGAGAITAQTAGEIHVQKFDNAGTANDYTIVFCDVDADTAAEFQIQLKGLYTLTAADFIL